MGLRFRKSFKIAPGVKVNVGKKSAGISVGGKYGGVSVNSKTGARVRASAPGTGLSYQKTVNSKSGVNNKIEQNIKQVDNKSFVVDENLSQMSNDELIHYTEEFLEAAKTARTDEEVERYHRALRIINLELDSRKVNVNNSRKRLSKLYKFLGIFMIVLGVLLLVAVPPVGIITIIIGAFELYLSKKHSK